MLYEVITCPLVDSCQPPITTTVVRTSAKVWLASASKMSDCRRRAQYRCHEAIETLTARTPTMTPNAHISSPTFASPRLIACKASSTARTAKSVARPKTRITSYNVCYTKLLRPP